MFSSEISAQQAMAQHMLSILGIGTSEEHQPPQAPPNSTDLDLALHQLRHAAQHSPRAGDRIRASEILLTRVFSTVEGLVEAAIKAGIGPAELDRHLREQMEKQMGG